MFFDMDLLCRQRQGKFAVVWLAATRGIETISRQELDQVNILRICEEIFKYVMSDSKSPRNRFSLYLSANLIHGMSLIYQKQAYNFEQSILTFICKIKRPICIVNFSFVDGEIIVEDKIKKRRSVPKKQLAIEAPKQPNEENAGLSLVQQQEIELNQCEEQLRRSLAQQELNITHGHNITIRDEVSGFRNPQMEPFGDEGQIDYQLAQFAEEIRKTTALPVALIPDPSSPDQPLPKIPLPEESTLLPQGTTTIRTTGKRPPSPTAEVATSKRRRVQKEQKLIEKQEQQIEAKTVEVDPAIVIIPTDPPIEAMAVEVAPANVIIPTDPPIEAMAVEVDPANVIIPTDPTMLPIHVPDPNAIATPKTPKRRSLPRARHLLNGSVKDWKGVLEMNRPIFDFIGLTKRAEPQRVRNVDAVEIMSLLLSGLRFSDQDISAVAIGNAKENTTIETSAADFNIAKDLSKRLTRDRDQTPMEVSVQELAVPLPMQVNNEIEEQVMEMVPEVQSPRLSNILKPAEEITSICEVTAAQGQGGAAGVYRPRIHASTPLVFDTEFVRQQALISRLKTLFVEEGQQQVTMWQLVFPLSRFKVAMAFSDLLHLQAKGYALLIPVVDTNELQFIQPGKKIFKK